jgi:hypothetical protein
MSRKGVGRSWLHGGAAGGDRKSRRATIVFTEYDIYHGIIM